MAHRFIHYQGPNQPEVVDGNEFESDKPNQMRSFLDLKSYWAAQIVKGGQPAEMVKDAQRLLNGDESEPIEIDSLSIDDNMAGSGENQGGDTKPAKKTHGPRGSYQRYTKGQVVDMLGYKFDKMLSINKAAKLAGIQPRTAATMVKKFKEDMDNCPNKSARRKCGRKEVLGPEHHEFIIATVDEDPYVTAEEIAQMLEKKFVGLKVKKSVVHEHMVNECRLSFKLVRPVTEQRNSAETKEKRFKWAMVWNTPETAKDFFYRSVFIDESGFNCSMTPRAGWS
ncbi:hypothetical protein BGZ81_004150 [Podila clonocystis]|nr:hypothetical protein BGZ81_004150 [Podila clonocystis]